MKISHVNTIKNSINLFVDINTICNLNCPYCFARKEKEWNKEIEIGKVKFISQSLKFSKYSFNIILFGGEPLLHPKIKNIVNIFNNNPKVNKTIILTNGTLKGVPYDLDSEYVFTLHELSEKEFNNFMKNIAKPEKSIVNFVIKQDKTSIERYRKILKMKDVLLDIEHSQIYDDNIYIIEDLSHLNFLELRKEFVIDNKTFNYRDFLKFHKTLNPKEFICEIQELNIDLEGNISNDCSGIRDNIYDNPLFFKKYVKEYECLRNRCLECTGTIRTTKISKELNE